MLKIVFALTALAAAGQGFAAQPCDALRDQIDAKIRASGATNYSLTVIQAQANPGNGKVVGSCELGTRQIVYSAGNSTTAESAASNAAARSKPGGQSILTECKDGSVSLGGECKK